MLGSYYQEEHDGTGRGDGGNTQILLNGDDYNKRVIWAHAIKGSINHNSSPNLKMISTNVPGFRDRMIEVVEEAALPSGIIPVSFKYGRSEAAPLTA